MRVRVRQGGHDVPVADIERRFARGWANFKKLYAPLAAAWSVIENSVIPPRVVEEFR